MAQICQVIDGDAGFNHDGLQQFINDSGIAACRTNYQVVAIMGPQSSGKSTLMNHVVSSSRLHGTSTKGFAVDLTSPMPHAQFGTSFVEMDALKGRQQTTKGVWLANSPKIDEPVTLVMDLEGSDGRERGEDDTNFERQSALFALAVADVLLVNIWCHDIGREQGSGKPLLKTIFQVTSAFGSQRGWSTLQSSQSIDLNRPLADLVPQLPSAWHSKHATLHCKVPGLYELILG